MKSNIALLEAADKVEEAVNRQGDLCGEIFVVSYGITQRESKICNLPWNHPPPHSWEPDELAKSLKRALSSEIRMLHSSKNLEPWKAELCKAELLDRGEGW